MLVLLLLLLLLLVNRATGTAMAVARRHVAKNPPIIQRFRLDKNDPSWPDKESETGEEGEGGDEEVAFSSCSSPSAA